MHSHHNHKLDGDGTIRSIAEAHINTVSLITYCYMILILLYNTHFILDFHTC